MRKFYTVKRPIALLMTVLFFACAAWFLLRPRYKTIEIKREDFDYIHFGGKYLTNTEAHKEIIDELIGMISGKYDYMGEWKGAEGLRISASTIGFYKAGKELVLRVGIYDDTDSMFNFWERIRLRHSFRMYFKPVSDPARLAEIRDYFAANGSEFAILR